MALILEGVSYAYAAGTALAQEALRGVSLSVASGGLVLVLGPSGSGKTTLLRLAAGLLEPTSGSAHVDGAGGPRAFRGAVGLAFQRPEAQFFAATVRDDVMFGPANLGLPASEAAAAARRALGMVGLDPDTFDERSPFTLSGGEARRAALAGVLAMSPSYLLLDEPTSGLDADGRSAVAAAVERARAEAGVVVVTHDADEFLASADHVLVLRDGSAAFSGTVHELLAAADDLEAQGDWTPPETVRAQLLARARGRLAGPPVLDTEAAAIAMAGAAR
jgi:energy-coupling factor transport system ATP-binding protein